MNRWLWWTIVGFLATSLGIRIWLEWLELSLDSPYHLVENGLYLGRWVDQPPPGTRAVANLCGRPDPYTCDAHHWEPILEGGDDPDLDWLRRAVEFVVHNRRAGKTTFVHCHAGANRSATVVAAYLMHERHWSRDQAVAFLQSRRAVVQPNPTLMRLLAEWESETRCRQ